MFEQTALMAILLTVGKAWKNNASYMYYDNFIFTWQKFLDRCLINMLIYPVSLAQLAEAQQNQLSMQKTCLVRHIDVGL